MVYNGDFRRFDFANESKVGRQKKRATTSTSAATATAKATTQAQKKTYEKID